MVDTFQISFELLHVCNPYFSVLYAVAIQFRSIYSCTHCFITSAPLWKNAIHQEPHRSISLKISHNIILTLPIQTTMLDSFHLKVWCLKIIKILGRSVDVQSAQVLWKKLHKIGGKIEKSLYNFNFIDWGLSIALRLRTECNYQCEKNADFLQK